MDSVVHFEMPAEDKGRMVTFYEGVFGWKTTQLGPEMGDYVLVTTTETDKNGMISAPGAINGGFYPKTVGEPRGQNPRVVIAVDDIHEAMKKVTAAGGTVLGGDFAPGEPDDIPGVGLYAAFIDTEGNQVGMLQAAPQG